MSNKEVSENGVSVHFYYRLAWATRIQFVFSRYETYLVNWSVIMTILGLYSCLSDLAIISWIRGNARSNFHFDLLWFGYNSKTRSWTWTFSLIRNHLFGGNKSGAKYLIQHFQNPLTRSCVLDRRCLGLILSSGSGWGGGRCWPIRISFGVTGGVS